MGSQWQCAKCDGATDVTLHSRHCPKHDQDQGVSLVEWSKVHQLQRRPDRRDNDDASPGMAN
jgi:hypothetical protein